MVREAINPESLHSTRRYYSQAIRSKGQQIIHCAGQVALDGDGNLVGPGDVVVQCRQALANLAVVLTEAGATPADVARIRIYVVNHKTEYLEPVSAELAAFFGDIALPASTWLGVASLAMPGFLIEIEVTAVLDH
jgi:enamine deaminase RidA (YjgF/YER057c/UK114 family)